MLRNFYASNPLLNRMVFFIASHALTHGQNGSIERKHIHIFDMGLILLVAAFLPIKFWGEAFTIATYLINILLSPVLQNKSPHALFFHTTPNYT